MLLIPSGALLGRRKNFAGFLSLLACGALLGIALTGCGVFASAGSGSAPGSTPPGNTPSGTYLLTVTGAIPGVQKSVTLTLVIE